MGVYVLGNMRELIHEGVMSGVTRLGYASLQGSYERLGRSPSSPCPLAPGCPPSQSNDAIVGGTYLRGGGRNLRVRAILGDDVIRADG